MRKDFRDIYLHVKRKGMIPTLFTNGTMITERTADFLAEYRPLNIEITLYGYTQNTYERVTGKPIVVPDHHEVTGALGAASIAAEYIRKVEAERQELSVSNFKGFENLTRVNYTIKSFTYAYVSTWLFLLFNCFRISKSIRIS